MKESGVVFINRIILFGILALCAIIFLFTYSRNKSKKIKGGYSGGESGVSSLVKIALMCAVIVVVMLITLMILSFIKIH